MQRSRHHTVVLAIVVATLLGMIGSVAAAAQTGESDDAQGTWDQVVQVGLVYSTFDAVFNGRDRDAAAKLVDEHAVIETPFGSFTGPDGLVEFVSIMHRSYPDAVFGITGITAQADSVRVEWHMSATEVAVDPKDPVMSMSVERTGTASINFGEQAATSAAFDFETAVAPLPSQESAGVPPFAERPGQTAF